MLQTPAFWLAISFILFIAATFKPVGRVIISLLDKRAANIQKELDEAVRLKEEAQALLASYQRRQKEIAEEARRIVTSAEEEARNIISEAEKNFEENTNKRINLAMQKIANYEYSVIHNIRTNAIDIALGIVMNLVKDKLTAEVSDKMISQALNEMNEKMH